MARAQRARYSLRRPVSAMLAALPGYRARIGHTRNVPDIDLTCIPDPSYTFTATTTSSKYNVHRAASTHHQFRTQQPLAKPSLETEAFFHQPCPDNAAPTPDAPPLMALRFQAIRTGIPPGLQQ